MKTAELLTKVQIEKVKKTLNLTPKENLPEDWLEKLLNKADSAKPVGQPTKEKEIVAPTKPTKGSGKKTEGDDKLHLVKYNSKTREMTVQRLKLFPAARVAYPFFRYDHEREKKEKAAKEMVQKQNKEAGSFAPIIKEMREKLAEAVWETEQREDLHNTVQIRTKELKMQLDNGEPENLCSLIGEKIIESRENLGERAKVDKQIEEDRKVIKEIIESGRKYLKDMGRNEEAANWGWYNMISTESQREIDKVIDEEIKKRKATTAGKLREETDQQIKQQKEKEAAAARNKFREEYAKRLKIQKEKEAALAKSKELGKPKFTESTSSENIEVLERKDSDELVTSDTSAVVEVPPKGKD